jgi:hypothetical protein
MCVKIGMIGFEPTASCSQSRRATKLRYIPKPSSSGNAIQFVKTKITQILQPEQSP